MGFAAEEGVCNSAGERSDYCGLYKGSRFMLAFQENSLLSRRARPTGPLPQVTLIPSTTPQQLRGAVRAVAGVLIALVGMKYLMGIAWPTI